MKTPLLLTAFVFATLTALPASAQTSTNTVPADTSMDHVRLQASDRLFYSILEDPKRTHPEEIVVSSLGRIRFHVSQGYSNTYIFIDVTGKTLGQVREELKAALEAEYYHKATVQLELSSQTLRKGVIYLDGEVNAKTFEFDMVQPPTFYEVMMKVGTTQYANEKKIFIYRQNPEGGTPIKITLNLDEMKKGNRKRDIPLQDQDTIEVPEDRFSIF